MEQVEQVEQRAVILSGSLGLGHEMMVRSCASVLGRSGWGVRSLDSMAMLGSRCGPAGERLFTRVVGRTPGLYDALHFAHLRTGSPLAAFMDDRAGARLVPALRRELAMSPADLVLSVFATGASAAAKLKQEAPDRRTVVLCADVTLHRLWVAEGTDLFLTTSPAARASVLRYLPRARTAVIPPPVRPEFGRAPSRERARAALGLPPDRPCVLVIDSGWGFGPLERSVRGLAEAGVEVLAVAGRRASLEARLRSLAAATPLLHPFGFVDDVPLLMAASDVVTALPGATTCGEARAVGRPLLLLDLMPGHGRDNLLHELELGGARVAGPAPEDFVAAAQALLDDRPAVPRPPVPGAWESAFAAALEDIGLELRAGELRAGEVRDAPAAAAGPSAPPASPAADAPPDPFGAPAPAREPVTTGRPMASAAAVGGRPR
ncbi:MAG: glycosyl hydrolase [Acidimicrobiales bacterium]